MNKEKKTEEENVSRKEQAKEETIVSEDGSSPEQNSTSHKPFYKKWRFWGILGVVALVIALAIVGATLSKSHTGYDLTSSHSSYYKTDGELDEALENASMEELDAIHSAREYLENVGGFSEKTLVKQLVFEGYPEDTAQWAVDDLDVDWNEQAADSAATHMESGDFSHNSLLEQLRYEGFTTEQAEYGVTSVGL